MSKNGKKTSGTPFSGNGMSRTAMVFRIATMAGHVLTPVYLNKVKALNPRSLERVYDEVMHVGESTNAQFALGLMLK